MPASCFDNIKKLIDLKDIIKGKKVLVRVDFNVPLTKSGMVEDSTRIRAVLPTINFLSDHAAKAIIIISHLGRPYGKLDGRFSLKPVSIELQNLLKKSVTFIDNCIGANVKESCDKANNGQIILLENLRFHPEEEEEEVSERVVKFREELTELADIFVQDAFGCLHRPHSSIVGVQIATKAMGMLVEKEIQYLSQLISSQKIDTIILGGAKLDDKIPLLDNFLSKTQNIVLVGAVPIPFLKAKGYSIGDYCFDQKSDEIVKRIIQRSSSLGTKLYLPEDFIVAKDVERNATIDCLTINISQGIPHGYKVSQFAI